MSEHLDDFERDQLRRAERTIRKGLRTFVQVGEALLTIRDARLYRETHPSFEDYCRDRWAISKTHGNRLVQAAAVMRELPAEDAPTSERQARELAPLLDRPGVMRRAWAAVVHRTGGKPTAKAVRDVVHETITQPPAGSGAAPEAPDCAGEGAPAGAGGGARPAGDTRPNTDATAVGEHPLASNGGGTNPPAKAHAGEGGPAGVRTGEPAQGAPDNAPGGSRPGAPANTRPDPQPVIPPQGPESGGTGVSSASSQAEDTGGAPPCARPVAQGGDAPTPADTSSGPAPVGHRAGPGEAVLTDAEIHEALTDEWSPSYLEETGCRVALVHAARGAPLDRAVAAAMRQTCRPGRLPLRAKAVRS